MGLGGFLGKAGAALAGALGTAGVLGGTAGVLGALTGGGVSQSAIQLSAPRVECAFLIVSNTMLAIYFAV